MKPLGHLKNSLQHFTLWDSFLSRPWLLVFFYSRQGVFGRSFESLLLGDRAVAVTLASDKPGTEHES